MELNRSAAVLLAEKPRAFSGFTFIVVVSRRAFPQEPLFVYGFLLDRCHPLGFRLGSRFQTARLMRFGVQDKLGDVARLLQEHVRKVCRQSILRDAHMETVREPEAVKTVQRFETTGPILGE